MDNTDVANNRIVNAYIQLFHDHLDRSPFEHISQSKIKNHSKIYKFLKGKARSIKNLEKTIINYDAKMYVVLLNHKETNITVEDQLEIVIEKHKIGTIKIEESYIPEDSDDDRYLSVELKTTSPLRIDGVTVPEFKVIASNKNDLYHFETHVLIKQGKNYVRQNNFNHIISKHALLNPLFFK